jgi:hypothetical protein
MTYAMVETYCASYSRPPRAVTLDIDDTLDVVHGHQQLSLFNAHYALLFADLQHEADLIGEWRATTGAIGRKLGLM